MVTQDTETREYNSCPANWNRPQQFFLVPDSSARLNVEKINSRSNKCAMKPFLENR
jgi:hypothetical protein